MRHVGFKIEKQEEDASEREGTGDNGRESVDGVEAAVSKEEGVTVIGIWDGSRSGETERLSSSLELTRYTFLSASSWGGWGLTRRSDTESTSEVRVPGHANFQHRGLEVSSMSGHSDFPHAMTLGRVRSTVLLADRCFFLS